MGKGITPPAPENPSMPNNDRLWGPYWAKHEDTALAVAVLVRGDAPPDHTVDVIKAHSPTGWAVEVMDSKGFVYRVNLLHPLNKKEAVIITGRRK